MTSCQKAKKDFEHLAVLKVSLNVEIDVAAKTGDFTKAQALKAQLEKKLNELREKVDPWQYALRDKIAKEKGYDVVKKFNRAGIAVAVQSPSAEDIASGDPGFVTIEFLIDKTGKQIFEDDVDRLRYRFKRLQTMENEMLLGEDYHGKFYFFNPDGTPLLDPIKTIVGAKPFNKNETATWITVQTSDGEKEQVILKTDGQIIKSEATENPWMHHNFSEGLAVIEEAVGQFYFMGPNGKKIFGPFSFAEPFQEGLAIVSKSPSGTPPSQTVFKFINRKGTELPGLFTDARSFNGGLAPVQSGETSYYINQQGQKAIDIEYIKANEFRDGAAFVVTKDGNFLINPQGQKITKPITQCVNPPGGTAIITEKKSGKTYLIDKKTGQKLSSDFQQIEAPKAGLCRTVNEDGTTSFIDARTGKTVLPGPYKTAFAFEEDSGTAIVNKDGEAYYIDRRGRKIFGHKSD